MRNRSKYIIAATAPIFLAVTVLILLLVFNSADTRNLQVHLVIDQDGGADDAMAIFMAVLYERYFKGPQLVGITTVFGNVDESQTFNNTQRILSIAERRDVSIYRGCSNPLIKGIEKDYFFGDDGLGDNVTEVFDPIPASPSHAVTALIELSHKYRGNLVVVALGALTNIAMAMKLDPTFLGRLSQLYVGVGHIQDEEHKEPEFNAAMDPEAYYIVAQNGQPDKLTIVPFSTILNSNNISLEWRNNVLGAIPTKIMQMQNIFERIALSQSENYAMLDPVVMAIALNESAIVEETRYSNNKIQLCYEDRGIVENEFTSAANSTARVVYNVMKEPYKEMLYEIFSSELDH